MKVAVELDIALGAGHSSRLGAAVEWLLATGDVITPVVVMVGTCRDVAVKGGDFRNVVARAVRLGVAQHTVALEDVLRRLGVGTAVEANALEDEVLPRVVADMALMAGVMAEITRPAEPAEAVG